MSYILIIILVTGSEISPGFAHISEQFYTGDACNAALKQIVGGIGDREDFKLIYAGCQPKGQL